MFQNCSTYNSLLHVEKLKVMHRWILQYRFNYNSYTQKKKTTKHIYIMSGNNYNEDIHKQMRRL